MTEAEDIARILEPLVPAYIHSAHRAREIRAAMTILAGISGPMLHVVETDLCLRPRLDRSVDAGKPWSPEDAVRKGWDDWSECSVGYDRQEAGWPRRPEAQGDRG